MSGFAPKVFIVQRATGEVIAVKTRFIDAHVIAKAHAPCRVLFAKADKGNADLNVMDYDPDHTRLQVLAQN